MVNEMDLPPLSGDAQLKLMKKLKIDAENITMPDIQFDMTANTFIAASTAMVSLNKKSAFQFSAGSNLWKLNRLMNSAEARPPFYITACEYLGLDPAAPVIGEVTLQPWQVIGIAWARIRKLSTLNGGILNDMCGLSKTIQMLMLIETAARVATAPHQPTLILAPSGIIDM